jgi:hypothetical protein
MYMEIFATAFPFLVFGYVVSAGFGMVVGKRRGFEAVNRFWLRTIRGAIRGLINLLIRILRWFASLF